MSHFTFLNKHMIITFISIAVAISSVSYALYKQKRFSQLEETLLFKESANEVLRREVTRLEDDVYFFRNKADTAEYRLQMNINNKNKPKKHKPNNTVVQPEYTKKSSRRGRPKTSDKN